MLYDGLANDGRVRPLRFLATRDAPADGVQLFGADAVGRINAILQGSPSLAGRAPAALSTSAPIIAYKTGTSYGYRDAWAAGHSGGLTIVVWTGRADGAPRPGETGRKVAAPLLFALFDAMTDGRSLRLADGDNEGDAKALVRLAPARKLAPPVILYPVPGSEIYPGAFGGDGVVFAASGGEGDYRWYVDGEEVRPAVESARAVWRPAAMGFYDIAVVDARGAATSAKVRVAAIE
jgi:penicillin-binding protein 1C